MKCPRCNSENTSISWLKTNSIQYWCRGCHSGFDVDRVAVKSTTASSHDDHHDGVEELAGHES